MLLEKGLTLQGKGGVAGAQFGDGGDVPSRLLNAGGVGLQPLVQGLRGGLLLIALATNFISAN